MKRFDVAEALVNWCLLEGQFNDVQCFWKFVWNKISPPHALQQKRNDDCWLTVQKHEAFSGSTSMSLADLIQRLEGPFGGSISCEPLVFTRPEEMMSLAYPFKSFSQHEISLLSRCLKDFGIQQVQVLYPDWKEREKRRGTEKCFQISMH